MYAFSYNTGSRTPTPQGYAPNPSYGTAPGYAINPAFVPPPPIITTSHPAPGPVSLPASVQPVSTPSPAPAGLQVPLGCYPLELAQFWRDEYRRGQPYPLHWALFVRTAPVRPGPVWRSTGAQTGAYPTTHRDDPGYGNIYELVGEPDTFTAQFVTNVAFSPEMLPDWRGTFVVGWVHPGALRTFERVARGVGVWRQRPGWRCQEWVFDVLCALGEEERRMRAETGWWMDVWTFPGLQRQMGKLLDAWENGDI